MKTTLCYFSATDTTRKTLRAIAAGMDAQAAEVDFTLPADRAAAPAPFGADDFVIFGVPVYGGLMPLFCRNYLAQVKGNGTPCAIVGVYGNRAFDDCLVEMEDLVKENGFQVIAAGAFLGEHSFSDQIAGGRPDASDLAAATAFGTKLAEKLAAGAAALPQGAIPGNRPYKERGPAGATPGPATSDACVNCKLCANKCPMGAIDKDDVTKVDSTKCIRCLRCVRVCPTKAKAFTDEAFANTVAFCIGAFGQPRKEPEVFI